MLSGLEGGENDYMPVSLIAKREFRTYYVVFQSTTFRRPWNLFTWNGYQHVWLFYPKYLGPPGLLTHQATIKIEPLSTYLDTDYWACDPDVIAQDFIKEDYVRDIVKISLPLPSNLSYNIRGLINCVTIIKLIMGVGKWFIFTPQQLRRYLLRIGGRSIKNGTSLTLHYSGSNSSHND